MGRRQPSSMPKVFSKEILGKDRVDGHYKTPPLTTEYMCEFLIKSYQPGQKILDPAVGEGTFVQKLLDLGVRAEDITAYDIDPEKIELVKALGINAFLRDATYAIDDKFDYVIGNPPYNGDESHYVRENRSRLERDYPSLKARNTLSIIMFNCIRSLNKGGVFCFISADGFLTQKYYLEFREYLINNTRISDIILAPAKLFNSQKADQRTCIIAGTKETLSHEDAPLLRALSNSDESNLIRLVDRLSSESQYSAPPKVEFLNQADIHIYPEKSVVIGASDYLRKLLLHPPGRLGDIVQGGTGISTGKDSLFIKKRAEVGDDPQWVPYFKNGARNPFWYLPDYFIEKDYKKNDKAHKTFMLRNERYFFKEGISCSSVGIRFSAAYMPPNCLFGVNANFFFNNRDDLFYTLGYLNSRLAWFMLRKMIIRTNNASANYIRQLPYAEPADQSIKQDIVSYVHDIIESMREGVLQDPTPHISNLSQWFYDIFEVPQSDIEMIEDFAENFMLAM